VTIDGEPKIVDASEAEIEGESAVWLKVIVKGTLVDGIIVASKIDIRES